MVPKRKGHLLCPNCKKETDFILKEGEAVVWCRKCRCYFRAVLKVEEKDALTPASRAGVTEKERA